MIPEQKLQSERLVLRCWHPDDAPRLSSALEMTWDELQRWIPWVFPRRESVAQLAERLAGYRRDFLEGRDALYAVMDTEESEVWGGAGLYRRVGDGGLEIGYWVRSDQAGRGVATEASALLTRAAFGLEGIERLEIRCDPEHVASAAIPRKLGFRHRETLAGGCIPAGDARDTMIWVMGAEEYRDSPAASAGT
jgi:RimJ/RimL family protein N-acetyltransferase